jgi:hypothetical protein
MAQNPPLPDPLIDWIEKSARTVDDLTRAKEKIDRRDTATTPTPTEPQRQLRIDPDTRR